VICFVCFFLNFFKYVTLLFLYPYLLRVSSPSQLCYSLYPSIEPFSSYIHHPFNQIRQVIKNTFKVLRAWSLHVFLFFSLLSIAFVFILGRLPFFILDNCRLKKNLRLLQKRLLYYASSTYLFCALKSIKRY
jgi:hypothetical protein